MNQTKYAVRLSVDGNHAVTVESDDPASITAALVWAKDTHKKLVRFGRTEPANEVPQTIDDGADLNGDDAPTCEVHQVPMVLMHGRRGDFWSCHEKNIDGSWCSFKPDGHLAKDWDIGVNRMT